MDNANQVTILHVLNRLRLEWERCRNIRLIPASESLHLAAIREEESAARRYRAWRDKYGFEPLSADYRWYTELAEDKRESNQP